MPLNKEKKGRFSPKSVSETRNSLKRVFSNIGQKEVLSTHADSSSQLSVFPTDARYEAQNKGEVIVYIIREHVVMLIPRFLAFFSMLLAPILVILFLSSLDFLGITGNSFLVLGLVIFWYLIALTYAFQSYLYWYYNLFLVTNQRVIDFDNNHLAGTCVSGTAISSIEDVSVAQDAVLQNVFNFGNVYIQTAGARNEFEMVNVPMPHVLEDTIIDLSVGSNNRK